MTESAGRGQGMCCGARAPAESAPARRPRRRMTPASPPATRRPADGKTPSAGPRRRRRPRSGAAPSGQGPVRGPDDARRRIDAGRQGDVARGRAGERSDARHLPDVLRPPGPLRGSKTEAVATPRRRDFVRAYYAAIDAQPSTTRRPCSRRAIRSRSAASSVGRPATRRRSRTQPKDLARAAGRPRRSCGCGSPRSSRVVRSRGTTASLDARSGGRRVGRDRPGSKRGRSPSCG